MTRKLFALLLVSLCFACGKEHDSKLVGNWTGSEKNGQYENTTKSWIQNRYKDGTYDIVFITIEDCETYTFAETGIWWTDNGSFFEQAKHQPKPEVYNYKVIDDYRVGFILKKANQPFLKTDYKFIDTKIQHD